MDAFAKYLLLKKEQKKDAEMDALQAGMAALQMQQQEQDQERERRKEEEQLHSSLEYRAIKSLWPRSDLRMRLVIDTNIYLKQLHPGVDRPVSDVWDQFEVRGKPKRKRIVALVNTAQARLCACSMC